MLSAGAPDLPSDVLLGAGMNFNDPTAGDVTDATGGGCQLLDAAPAGNFGIGCGVSANGTSALAGGANA